MSLEYEVPRFAIHMAREGSPVRVSTPEAAAEVARQICCADAATVAHNHPSGSAAPSAEDDHVTRSVAKGAKAVGVQFIDHVIVTECGHAYSYLDKCPGALKA